MEENNRKMSKCSNVPLSPTPSCKSGNALMRLMSTRNFIGSDQNSAHPSLDDRWITHIQQSRRVVAYLTRMHRETCLNANRIYMHDECHSMNLVSWIEIHISIWSVIIQWHQINYVIYFWPILLIKCKNNIILTKNENKRHWYPTPLTYWMPIHLKTPS